MGVRSTRIVCGHIAQLPLAWASCKLSKRKSYYLVAHGIEVWRPFTFVERRALLGARLVLCVSDFTRRQLLENCPVPPERTVILPNALDPNLDPPSIVSAAAGPPVILAMSRLSAADSYKGIDHLIAAMPAVRAAIPDARLRIVGRGDALPDLQRLGGAGRRASGPAKARSTAQSGRSGRIRRIRRRLGAPRGISAKPNVCPAQRQGGLRPRLSRSH